MQRRAEGEEQCLLPDLQPVGAAAGQRAAHRHEHGQSGPADSVGRCTIVIGGLRSRRPFSFTAILYDYLSSVLVFVALSPWSCRREEASGSTPKRVWRPVRKAAGTNMT